MKESWGGKMMGCGLHGLASCGMLPGILQKNNKLGGFLMKSILAAAFLVLGFSGDALACFPRVKTINGVSVDGYMTVKSGRACVISFRSSGPTDRVQIDQRPSHGVVDIGSVGRLRYRPNRGYTGSDTFVYSRVGLDNRNNPATRTVRVHVTITQ